MWRQLVLLVLVTALPLVLAAMLMFRQLVEHERANTRQSLVTDATQLASLVDNEIAMHAAIAFTLAQSPALQTGDLAIFWQEATDALKFVPGAWLTLSTPQGQVVLSTLARPGSQLPSRDAAETLRRAFSTRSLQLSGIAPDPGSGKLTAFIDVPVFRGDQPLYALSISLLPDRFLEMITKNFGHGEVIGILDQHYNFIARLPDHERRVGTLASEGWRAAIAEVPTGLTQNKTLEGNLSLTGYARTAYGWTVGVARLETQMAAPLDSIFWWTVFAAGTLLFISLLLALAIARHASRGMSSLAALARDVGAGRQVGVPTAPFAEAKTIAETLSRASTELKLRGELLAQANTELEAKVAQRTAELVAEMGRREKSEATLRQFQKMESIGQLTGGIAHDFNNMLTIIIGNLDTALRRLKKIDSPQATTLQRPLEMAAQGANSAARLTHRLLAFSRQQPLEPKAVDVNAAVASLNDLVSRTVGENIKVETVLAAGLWPAFADLNQIETCLVNLVANARDAMPNGGRLTIETANAYLDEDYASRFADVTAGQYVMMSLTDSGTGIPADVLEKVFDPFFTTKAAGKGTGLGLAMVYGFVKQSGGHVRIYSELGEGTSIKIYLPRYTGKTERPAISPSAVTVARPEYRAAGEVILLVEDNPGVLEYGKGALEDLGYTVIACKSGVEALRVLKETPKIDLLFTDVVLGGEIGGKKLSEEAAKLRPSLPVLFTTGYTRNAIVHDGRLDAGVNLLNKPYTQRMLAEKIGQVLGQRTPA